jgi:hypothetical protein
MSDFHLQPHHTLIVGMTGCGKTTFVNRLLLNDAAPACRFIYDDLNRVWPRLRLPVCHTPAQLAASLPTQWSVFHPAKILPECGGDGKKAFRWWLKWVFAACQAGPGRKIVCLPEVWKHCTPDSIPPELALLSQAGRELGIELVCDTQNPERLNGSLIGACTEIVCFRLMNPESERALKNILTGAGIAAATAPLCQQPMGTFTGFNRISGATLSGKVF